jgi:uncharacterized protein YkwD
MTWRTTDFKAGGGRADSSNVRRPPARLLVALACSALVVLSGRVSAGTVDEQEIVRLVNATRAVSGLPALSIDAGLVSFARWHTREMSERGDIFHSGKDVRVASAPAGWTRLGENVGMGGSAERLHELFMQSPGHRANVLGDFSHLAVGADRGANGRLYVTVVFVKKSHDSPQLARSSSQPAMVQARAGSD